MEWWLVLAVFFSALLVLLLASVPVGFAFLALTFAIMYWVMGARAPQLLINSVFDSLTQFTLTPIPLFVLMGGLIFHSGLLGRAVRSIEGYLGGIPGRVAVVSLVAGALFGSVSGSTLANTAILGSMLLPEMRNLGYDKKVSAGAVIAAGTLAMLIPPSTLAVVLGSLANVSVGKLLIGGIVPGLMLTALYVLYVVGVCWRWPVLAPAVAFDPPPLSERLWNLIRVLAPLGGVIFLAVGSILVGWATPTEAAALGTVGALLLTVLYRQLTRRVLGSALLEAVKVTSMVLLIVAGSTGFSQVLAFSGATRGLVQAVLSLPFPPWGILLGMMVVVQILSLFMEELAIIMITVPLFMPLVRELGFDPLWFGILMLIALQVSLLTPPVGMVLYVAKSVAPPDYTMQDIWLSVVPYIAMGVLVMLLVGLWPEMALWLPNLSQPRWG